MNLPSQIFPSDIYVVVPEGKESILSQRLTRPVGLLSAGSTPRSTPRSTPIRSLSPAVPRKIKARSKSIKKRILKKDKQDNKMEVIGRENCFQTDASSDRRKFCREAARH